MVFFILKLITSWDYRGEGRAQSS